MAAQSLDHVNIYTDDLEGTIAFYTDIIGLKNGERPPFDSVGAWIYCGDQAVIHLVAERPSQEGTGVIHHVAFRAEGIDDMRNRLTAEGLDFFEREVQLMPLKQIFVDDPNGVKIELNFWDEA